MYVFVLIPLCVQSFIDTTMHSLSNVRTKILKFYFNMYTFDINRQEVKKKITS